jgi:hypothetical protein
MVRTVVLYTGTLGLKHNPRMLLALGEQLESRRHTSLVVVSEGPSAVWLGEQARLRRLSVLEVMPFQPFEIDSDVLGSADVLVSILERGAGSYSVAAKVLSYLCAGRPIVLSAPRENLAAKIIARAGAGKVVPADDSRGSAPIRSRRWSTSTASAAITSSAERVRSGLVARPAQKCAPSSPMSGAGPMARIAGGSRHGNRAATRILSVVPARSLASADHFGRARDDVAESAPRPLLKLSCCAGLFVQ